MFTIRVYGIWIRNDHILLTEEDVMGNLCIKFPGGGLEFGEGTLDCLKREFREELNIEIEIKKHIYTTDFFVRSFLNPAQQVLSIYYLIEEAGENKNTLPSFAPVEENKQSFFWKKLNDIEPELFSFPIDREVIRRIKNGYIPV